MPYGCGRGAGEGSTFNHSLLSGWGRRTYKSDPHYEDLKLTDRESKGYRCGRGQATYSGGAGRGHPTLIKVERVRIRGGVVHAVLPNNRALKPEVRRMFMTINMQCGKSHRFDMVTQKSRTDDPVNCMACMCT